MPQNQNFFEVGDCLPHALYISGDVEGRVYLLNPRIVTSGGEWEAWYLDISYMLGAIRFRSFWHLMEDAFRGYTS